MGGQLAVALSAVLAGPREKDLRVGWSTEQPKERRQLRPKASNVF
jgi:hypothetical protein